MKKAKMGDRVLVHFVKRFENGVETSSRAGGAEPVELMVGTPDSRLPGLRRELVGLTPGQDVIVTVPAGQAYQPANTTRVVRVARSRFPLEQPLVAGQRVRFADRSGRTRSVRVVSVTDRMVVVDANHPRAGQGLELDIELIAILTPAAELSKT